MIAKTEEATPTFESRATKADRRVSSPVLAAVYAAAGGGTLPIGMPPHKFVPVNGSVALRASPGAAASLGRQDFLLIGAMLANGVLAVRRCGLDCELTLLTEPSGDGTLARLTPTVPAVLSDMDLRMRCAIQQPTADSAAPSPKAEPLLKLLAMLRRAARESGTWLDLVMDDARRTLIADLLARANQLTRWDQNARRLVAWYGASQSTRPYVPERDQLRAALPVLGGAIQYAPCASEASLYHAVMRGSVVVVIGTEDDSRAGWMRSGIALQRVLLLATAAGLCATVHTEVAEQSALRDALGALVFSRSFPQVVLHFTPLSPPSP